MRLLFMILMGLGLVAGVWAAEPIEGAWMTESRETVGVVPCGGAFCMTVQTGKYAGKEIGKLVGKGESYRGTVTDPKDGKVYEGSAKVAGGKLVLKGCVLKVFCKGQVWVRMTN